MTSPNSGSHRSVRVTRGSGFDELLETLTDTLGLDTDAQMAAEQAILTSVSAHNASWPDPVSIAQTAAILEHSALISYRDSLLRNAESGAERDRSEQLFDQAHGCYRLLSEMQLAGIQALHD